MGRFAFVVAVLVWGWRCNACTMVWQPVKVGPSFRIKVSSEGRPVKRLALKVNNKRFETDNNGLVYFREMPPGSYFVAADHDNGYASSAELEVKADGPADVTVPLTWPSISPLRVSSLTGALHFSDITGQPLSGVAIDLLEGISGRRLKSTQTTDDGAFDFAETPAGFYFLNVNKPFSGLIAVTVDPASPQDHLDLELQYTSCGLYYSDRIRCSAGELQVQQLCGQVVDAASASIGDATISLYDENATPKLIGQTRSNAAGNFSMPTSVPGMYELIIASPGFTTLRKRVHVDASNRSACSRPVKVQLVVVGGGECSTVQ